MEPQVVNTRAPAPTQENDQLLASFIRILNNIAEDGHDVGLGVTLIVSGQIVSGDLCSAKAYFEGVGERFRESGKGKSNTEVYDAFAKAVDGYRERVYAKRAPDDDELPIGFVHLREAFFHGTDGARVPTHDGLFVRVRLTEVSGFTFGRF